jgi:hypothetical protein
VKESVRVGDSSAEGSRRSELGVAVAELGRQTVRGRSLGCGGDCTLHFQRNSTRASGCAGSDRILQPAATRCQRQKQAPMAAWSLPGVAVVMSGKVVLVLGGRGDRYACRVRAAGWQALAGCSTSRRDVEDALKGTAPVGAKLPSRRRVPACSDRV